MTSPLIALATCFLLVVSWTNPGPVYAGEIPGVVEIDGDRMVFLTLRENNPTLAIWDAVLFPGERVITDGSVVVTMIPSGVPIGNLPFTIACNQVWLPMVER